MPRRVGRAVLFAVAAAAAAWAAWPDSSVLHAAADQFGVIATVLLLAGLPLLARRFFGPVSDSRSARFLRVGGYAAILALIPARAVVGPYPLNVPRQGPDLRVFIADGNSTHGLPGTSAGGPPWPGEIFFLVLTACYVVTILWLTSRRSSVAPATLAVGTGVGHRCSAWSCTRWPRSDSRSTPPIRGCRDRQVDPFVALAWILLFGGPAVAGVLAGRWHCRRPGGSVKLARARVGQGIVAGVLANLVGALFVTVLGTGTAALTIEVAGLRPLVFHAPHASEAAAYGHVLHASQHVSTYVVMCVIFPVIGLMMSGMGMACFMPVPRESGPQPDGGGGPPGPGPEPAPEPPPPGGRLADAENRVPVLS